MVRENLVRLRGIVADNAKITTTSKGQYAVVNINIGRPKRDAGDGIMYMKVDNVRIMSQDPDIVNYMSDWKKWDIVDVKGVLTSRAIIKSSYCPSCHHKNSVYGSFVFVVPNYVEKLGAVSSDKEGQAYLVSRREISNTLQVFGTLVREPKKLTTFAGLDFTQYQIAMARKFKVREDDPTKKMDFPWVKTYGKKARQDRKFLKKGAEVYIDGCIQCRTVERRAFCGQKKDKDGVYMTFTNQNPVIDKDENGENKGCGEEFYWTDRSIEIVPFSTEYISGVYTQEQAIAIEEERRKQSTKDKEANAKSLLYQKDVFDEVTDEDIEDGLDDLDEDRVD